MEHEAHALDVLYRKGIEHFNNKEFFECHEVLEELWFKEEGESKLFYQGLIQVAVAFHHYENENYRGASKLLQSGIAKLRNYPPEYKGIDLNELLAELERWEKRICDCLRGGRAEFETLVIPRLILKRI